MLGILNELAFINRTTNIYYVIYSDSVYNLLCMVLCQWRHLEYLMQTIMLSGVELQFNISMWYTLCFCQHVHCRLPFRHLSGYVNNKQNQT